MAVARRQVMSGHVAHRHHHCSLPWPWEGNFSTRSMKENRQKQTLLNCVSRKARVGFRILQRRRQGGGPCSLVLQRCRGWRWSLKELNTRGTKRFSLGERWEQN